MYHRDYFLKLIEEAGRVLHMLFTLRTEKRIPEAMTYLEESFKSLFGIDWDVVRHTEPEALPACLREMGLDAERMDLISGLLQEAAHLSFDAANWEESKHYARQGLFLHAWLNDNEPGLFSMERAARDAWFEELIAGLGESA